MKFTKSSLLKIFGFAFFFGLFSIFIISNFSTKAGEFSTLGVEVRDGVQIISLKAGLGYNPNRIVASASMPTKLQIETKNTYDCTAFLNIPKLNIEQFLPPTGVTEIEVKDMQPGDEIEGFCGSEAYKFIIKFS